MNITKQTICRYVVCCRADDVERVVTLRDAGAYSSRGIWLESGVGESPHSPGLRSMVLCCDATDEESVKRIEGATR